MGRELVGYVYVDSGGIWVGDPCYVIGTDADHDNMSWSEFCDKVFGDKHPMDPVPNTCQPLGNGIGLNIETMYGDGTYPVYVTLGENGRPRKVEIEFDFEEEDE